MPENLPTARALVLRWGSIARTGLLAAALAALASWLLPGDWESTAVLLPPERRGDDFRYPEAGGGAQGLARVSLPSRSEDRTEPLDVWEAVVASSGTARQLVERFDLTRRWRERSTEDAVRRLQESISFEAVPYGPFRITVRTEDGELSAELANALAETLEQRIRGLYRTDVASEKEFLERASLEQQEDEVRSAARLAAARTRTGLADEAQQQREAAALAEELAYRVALARTTQALAERRYGAHSAEAQDAALRTRELEQAFTELSGVLPEAGRRAAEAELAELQQAAKLLANLRVRVAEHQAVHDVGVHLLDPAVVAEKPDRKTLARALLAALLVPAGAAVALRLGRAPRGGRRAGALIALGAAAASLVFVEEPLLLVAVLGVGFLVLLASDLRAAWLALVIALPYAWDYINEREGFAVQFPTEPGMILLAAAWAYLLLLYPRRLERTTLVRAMLLAIAWMAVSAVVSLDLRRSLFQFVSVSGFIVVGALFPLHEMRSLDEIERVVRIYLVSGTLLALYGIVQVISSPLPLGRAAFNMGEGLLYNHGPYTAFLGFALGAAFVYLLAERWSIRTLPLLAAAILMTVATVISFTRAAWVATVALLLAFGVFQMRLFARRAVVPLALVALLVVPAYLRSPVASQAVTQYWEVSTSAEYNSNVERIQRWIAALRMFVDRPLTGVGPGAYETAYPNYRDLEFSEGRRGTHSEILRAASEQGLPGLAILVFLVVSFYRTGLRLNRSADPRVRRLAVALCAGMFTYAVHGQFNEYWRDAKIALTMWVFVGLLGALERIDRSGGPAPAASG